MKIFITYSRTNKEPVISLANDLEELGHQVWYDQEINGGQSWWDNILSNIRDCEVYLYAITQPALDSTACKRELDYAKALNKTALPVLVDKAVSIAIIPRYLSNVQYVEYTGTGDKGTVFALLRAIGSLPASQPMPDPLPDPPMVPISYLDSLKDKIDSPSLDKRDQVNIVNELKFKLADPDNKKEDIYGLLKKLRKHEDLFASVSVEIDQILGGSHIVDPPKQPSVKTGPEAGKEKPPVNTPDSGQVKETVKPVSNQPGAAAGQGWTSGSMTILVILSFFFFPIGYVAGLIGIAGANTKSQGKTLLWIAIGMTVLFIVFLGGGA